MSDKLYNPSSISRCYEQIRLQNILLHYFQILKLKKWLKVTNSLELTIMPTLTLSNSKFIQQFGDTWRETVPEQREQRVL